MVGVDATHALLIYHSTSSLEARVQALDHEPTTLESMSQGFAVDTLSVTIDLSQIPAGL